MSTIIASPAAIRPVDPAAELLRLEPRFAATGFAMIMLLAPTAFAALVDGRMIGDAAAWTKPLKFKVSLAVYLLTLAFFARWLPAGWTQTSRYRLYSLAVVAMVAAEMLWLMGAAVFGVPSHFNRGGGFLEVVYPVMGLFAIGLTSATLVYGIAIARDRTVALAPAARASLVSGLVLTFVLTVAAAGVLASGEGHVVGTAGTMVERLPLMGWVRNGGDLRVAHFFATHAMHVIPVFGFLAAAALPARQGVAAVGLFSAGYVALVGYTLVQALGGAPFLG